VSVKHTIEKIAKARRDHTDAETNLFEAYVTGVPLEMASKFVIDLIDSDNALSKALTELLKELHG
jgi:hypothetical protein